MFEIWAEDGEIVRQDYEKDNIRIVNCNHKSNICLIFCSSNGLYFPNTEEEYVKKIRSEDRYEWENISRNTKIKQSVAKMIFIRDIYKQWYVTGVNSKLSNIDLLFEYLKNETKDYRIITVGSSAGGYMAVLIGLLLSAYRIITISGQYSLWDVVEESPFLKKYKNDSKKTKYYDLSRLLENSTIPILYIFPAKCPLDIRQYDIVKDKKNIYFFRVNSDSHGAGLRAADYQYLLLCNSNQVERIYQRYKGRLFYAEFFYCDLVSFVKKIGYILHVIINHLNKTVQKKLSVIYNRFN